MLTNGYYYLQLHMQFIGLNHVFIIKKIQFSAGKVHSVF